MALCTLYLLALFKGGFILEEIKEIQTTDIETNTKMPNKPFQPTENYRFLVFTFSLFPGG